MTAVAVDTNSIDRSQRSFGEPRLAYIVSQAHSGSTLLSLMIAAHSKAATIGEFKDKNELFTACACGASRVLDCEFWSKVDSELFEFSSRRLVDLRIRAHGQQGFAEDNEAFYKAVFKICGATILVDSSKSLSRLVELQQHTDLAIVPIFLRRHPAGVINSNVRKGRNWFSMTLKHYMGTRRNIENFRIVRHVPVDYSKLIANPRDVLSRVMSAVGAGFEEAQLDWASKPNHAINGNRMRFRRDSTIRPDNAWQTQLTWLQKSVIYLFTNDFVLENDTFAALVKAAHKIFLRVRRKDRDAS